MAFGKSMVWRKMKDHIADCYFCMTNLKCINRKNKHHVQYLDVPSATKPGPDAYELPVANVNVTVESSAESEVVHGSVKCPQVKPSAFLKTFETPFVLRGFIITDWVAFL